MNWFKECGHFREVGKKCIFCTLLVDLTLRRTFSLLSGLASVTRSPHLSDICCIDDREIWVQGLPLPVSTTKKSSVVDLSTILHSIRNSFLWSYSIEFFTDSLTSWRYFSVLFENRKKSNWKLRMKYNFLIFYYNYPHVMFARFLLCDAFGFHFGRSCVCRDTKHCDN